MPATPTREQFNAATKKVMETAPSGLSRDDFYALVDKELAGVSAPTAEEMMTHTGRMAPDQGTGVIAGLKSMGSGLAHPGVDTTTGKAKPMLETLGDVASLLIPSGLGMEGRTIADAGSRYMQGIKTAAADTHSIRDAATLPVRAYRAVKDALPSSNEKAVEEFLGPGRVEKYTPKPPTINNGADIVDRNMPKVKPAAVPLPPQAKTPTLNDALVNILEEAKGTTDPVTRTTLPMEHPPVSEGPFKQTWGKSKKQNLGGYSVGGRGTELAADPRLAEGVTGAATEAAPAMETAAPAAEVGGVTVTPDKPKLSSSEVAEHLRRMYGSRDGGRMLNSADPKGGAEALKRLAPGPSRIPLVAEARINGMPQDQTLEDALREIIINRSKLPPE